MAPGHIATCFVAQLLDISCWFGAGKRPSYFVNRVPLVSLLGWVQQTIIDFAQVDAFCQPSVVWLWRCYSVFCPASFHAISLRLCRPIRPYCVNLLCLLSFSQFVWHRTVLFFGARHLDPIAVEAPCYCFYIDMVFCSAWWNHWSWNVSLKQAAMVLYTVTRFGCQISHLGKAVVFIFGL